MRKVFYCIVVIVLALSCGGQGQQLREAEKLLKEDAVAALDLLESMPVEGLSKRQEARYNYLSAKAFYSSYGFLDNAHSIALAQAYSYREQERNRMANLALLIVAVLSTLVLYFWARKAQTEKLLLEEKQENDRMLSAAEDLQARLGELQQKGQQKLPIDTLDRLCEQYYIYEGTENLQPRILKEVRSIVEGLRSDPSIQKALEQQADDRLGGAMQRLRKAFPKWKEEDFLLYLFTVSGFSSTTISALLTKDKPYVYNRLYRIKERIKASDLPDKNDFLRYLEK